MKKYFLVIIMSTLSFSCSIPSFIFKNPAQTIGVDFSKGKWLLNYVESSAGTQKKMNALAYDDFLAILKERLVYVPQSKGILIPNKIEINPNKSQLSNLKKGTNFDYFINIKASNGKNQIGIIDLTPHKFNKGGINESEVVLEIYDLNTLEIIYSQSVVGFITRNIDNNDVYFSKSNDALLLGAYKKLINDLNKKSIFK